MLLNDSQNQAVSASPHGPLQVIAGPGTGKTKVLVARVARLLTHDAVPPQNIIVTTFTKKAANEMVQRLQLTLGNSGIDVRKLLIGTFHSICFRLLRKYGHLVGNASFSVADDKDSVQVLQQALEMIPEEKWKEFELETCQHFKAKTPSDRFHGFDPKKLRRAILSLKAANTRPESYSPKEHLPLLFCVYKNYQQLLTQLRFFDFDDCLMQCHLLLALHHVLPHIQHVLVDEFQDTNEIQLQLMYLFAHSRNVTIVGDPDQSIYGFRDAQAENFQKMAQYYAKLDMPVACVYLTNNYRSTAGILRASEQIMSQQQNRAPRRLVLLQKISFSPVKCSFASAELEARWVAARIHYMVSMPGNLVSQDDIAILVRSAYQTRALETELARKKIMYSVVRGKAFWERKEVIAIIDYLRCVGNPADRLAYLRSANIPKRGVGQKTIEELQLLCKPETPVLETLRNVSTGVVSSLLGARTRESLLNFVQIIDGAFRMAESITQCSDFGPMFDYLVDVIRGEFDDEAHRNIDEVRTQLMEFIFEKDQLDPDALSPTGSALISHFLSSVSLFDMDPEQLALAPKVALSTIHGAKGLEWPVVFVPGVSEGLLPALFAIRDNKVQLVEEERRCFYVATTRARALLYVTNYTEKEGRPGRAPVEKESRFLSLVEWAEDSDSMSYENVTHLSEILGKLAPDRAAFDQFERKFAQAVASDFQLARGMSEFGEKRMAAFRRKEGEQVHERQGKKQKQSRLFGGERTNMWAATSKESTFASSAQPASRKAPSLLAEVEVKKTVLKAPPYVPVRALHKRRLGTR